jgi:ADP-heptose:LPS heptosyltransferase
MSLRKTPLRGKYLVQNPALRATLTTVDAFLAAAVRAGRTQLAGRQPRRVLLSMGGHLGDVVIASSAIPIVQAAWPDAEIGLLVGSWSRNVVEGHPLVRRIHTVDHWKLNRARLGRLGKLRQFSATRRQALREIRAAKYDLAIELYPYFPNNIPILWSARIPVRVGYTSAGFGALLTHPLPWSDSDRHVAEYHRDLLLRAGARTAAAAGMRYSLPPFGPGSASEALSYFRSLGRRGEYLVLHMGAGLELKEWPLSHWHDLIGRLLEEGHSLLLTGSGAGQAERVELAIDGRAGCHNLCNQLSWSQFVDVLAGARLLVSVDSVAGHVAAGVNTPAVVLMSGINRMEQWRPVGERVTTISHPMPCSPCHQSRGCAAMSCVRMIEVDEVLAAVRAELAGVGELAPSAAER